MTGTLPWRVSWVHGLPGWDANGIRCQCSGCVIGAWGGRPRPLILSKSMQPNLFFFPPGKRRGGATGPHHHHHHHHSAHFTSGTACQRVIVGSRFPRQLHTISESLEGERASHGCFSAGHTVEGRGGLTCRLYEWEERENHNLEPAATRDGIGTAWGAGISYVHMYVMRRFH